MHLVRQRVKKVIFFKEYNILITGREARGRELVRMLY